MQKPSIPHDEDHRLHTLNSLGLLDTPPDRRFDRFTKLAQRVFDVPIALVSLVDYDRQWFKSCIGLSVSETSREISFCGHAILKSTPFVVENAVKDPRFADNPLVTGPPNIRFYAGYPLSAPNGKKIGTLCVISDQPREFSQDDNDLLVYLGELVEQEIRFLNEEVTDYLTGLYNEQGFKNMAERAISQTETMQQSLSIVYINLDNLHQLNDRYGYSLGDRVLVEFSELLTQAFNGAASIARLNHDNFAILLMAGMQEKIHQPMQHLIESVAIRNKTLHRPYELAFSIGLANFDASKHETISDLIDESQQAMLNNRNAKAI